MGDGINFSRCDRCGAVHVAQEPARVLACDCGGWCRPRRVALEPDAAELRVRLAAVRGLAKRALASGDAERMGIALLAIQTSGELADCLDAEREAS